MKRFVIILLIFIAAFSKGQNKMEFGKATKAVIPFQLINSLIFIPVQLNGVNLTFLLDSGVANTIIFSTQDKDLSLNDVSKMKFTGLGGSGEIEGVLSQKNILSFGKDLIDKEHTIYLILNEEFNFSSHIGIPVNGIIGYEFFKDYPVKIDYVKKKITVYSDQQEFERAVRKAAPFGITLEGDKPYIIADIQMTTTPKPSKLLIDLGNGDPVWIFPSLIKDFVYNRPNIDDYLGRGFNGDIFGKRSRIRKFSIGEFSFDKPLTAMPDEFSIQHLKLVPDRKGSIGGEILRRFTVFFDYPNSKIYLKKNRNYNDPFHFNMSGLDLRHDGMIWDKDLVSIPTIKSKESPREGVEVNLGDSFQYKFVLKPSYSIAGCREDSPAYKAGLRKNDKLVTVNGKPASSYTLEQLNELFKSEEFKVIKITVTRNSETFNFVFALEDPIPYQEN
ncbi:aspartyl protease family protein [Elizabethkingia anophelis]|uniref:PDZ domain-containing protein n=1 Tax=Elizabethkingia anophelis TaxID=1117645 RepID=UPI00038A4CBD|nr:PDZ domain-containing protein [Elizabethkingia anophelis]EQB93923.1 peptide-binding protein [Elizabethkingia anophelis 502]MCT4137483.1 aspartyl protease family protein [Elizabethkingia anophelis]